MENSAIPPPSSQPPQPMINVLTKQKSRVPLILSIIISLIVVVVVSYLLGKRSNYPRFRDDFIDTLPTQMWPTPRFDPTAGWVLYTDATYSFSFKHPARYIVALTFPGGSASQPGQIHFVINGQKDDNFFVDFVHSTDSVEAFLSKNITKQYGNTYLTANFLSSVMGDKISSDNDQSGITLYKYINRYDQKVNPGAIDIINYTAVFKRNNSIFVIRTANSQDKLEELKHMISTFQYRSLSMNK